MALRNGDCQELDLELELHLEMELNLELKLNLELSSRHMGWS